MLRGATPRSWCFERGGGAGPLLLNVPHRGRLAPRAAATAAEQRGKPSVVVVGGGWAGFSCTWQLLKQGFAVRLLDAAENPGGLSSGWRTPGGRGVEAGIKGFWYHYKNIDRLVDEELCLPESPFTPYTSSTFWSPAGKVVKAPIFQDLPRLPSPLSSLVYTLQDFPNLSILDRLSAWPLLKAFLEFDLDEASFVKYDRMSARELFFREGVSQELYDQFLEPVLLALLFVPLENLSAATALAVLNNYVLAHQPDFDVRWCRGSVAEQIFGPWVHRILEAGGVIEGGTAVEKIAVRNNRVASLRARRGGTTLEYTPDYVVLAAGVGAIQAINRSSPELAAYEEFRAINNFDRVDVLAARLWFDTRVDMGDCSSNVVAGFDENVAGTFFDLNTLQPGEYGDEMGQVVEVDLYNAAGFMSLDDSRIIEEVQQRYLGRCFEGFRNATVVDASVLKFPRAVTKFVPGSHAWMPPIRSSVANLFFAGDYVKHGPNEHGARGLSQEKAYVTGMQAALECSRAEGLPIPAAAVPIDVEPDEEHIAFLKGAVRSARELSL
mmetsp:Transcript_3449/g.12444  ORF Transcript_3449/g.12444 Transcript_3449/m.12444 type:complete len:551 (-) Transcript_3449:93-1745(-)